MLRDQIINNFRKPKKVNEYFDDFEPNKLEYYLVQITDIKKYSSLVKLKLKIIEQIEKEFPNELNINGKMIASGKTTEIYWKYRGWTRLDISNKIIKISRDKSSSPFCIEYYLKKGMNEIDAIFAMKSTKPINKEYWSKKGFSDEISIKKSKECKHNNNITGNKKVVSNIKNNPDYYNNINCTLEYYISLGYTNSESVKLLKERQTTFSKKICIEKYGKLDGVKIWQERQNKWQNTLNSKPQEEIDRINREKYVGCVSKSSQKLFDSLNIKDSFFHNQGGEYSIKMSNGKWYHLDFIYKNKIIEYNGDMWHMNPIKYNSNDICLNKKTAQEIWDYDLKRKSDLISLGYNVLCVWESEYNYNPEEIIKKCKEFCNGS